MQINQSACKNFAQNSTVVFYFYFYFNLEETEVCILNENDFLYCNVYQLNNSIKQYLLLIEFIYGFIFMYSGFYRYVKSDT